ncbi:prenyltransferase/squalene oxidase repeat-containing protein [Nonomuraea pusilla]|uniref:Prenyltransferase and squalene oxidase repeat-containing protein n=1 Tax=Nonomuraea pusilla TaxID=46177 RepID=A0A1H7KRY3_9ACTN|nr:prenyltransferase/squalene oxidase repeat-containing protein [Nonomuraea pusilla]SEK89559.1 Prenyltransferase and squalene oxidase repeat-containing protein [Nonomuraea pusilla]
MNGETGVLDDRGGTAAGTAGDLARQAGDLVAELMAKPWGQVSPSVYETGRLVTLAPWLVGHRERVAYLLARQRADGSWGAPDGYALVPTLSATEALLAAAARGEGDTARLRQAAEAGLRALRPLLEQASELPDTPAIELIVPSLVALVNEHGLGEPLPLPAGMDTTRLGLVRRLLESGGEPPQKLLHVLEVAGGGTGAAAVRPTAIGTVGASPAATAAWLERLWPGGAAPADSADSARRHLEAVATRYGGPVPVGLPITVFERGWVLSWLARAGVPVDVPPEMTADLRAAIGPHGTPAGAGLPADADTTSVALYALALLGMPCEPEPLSVFDTGRHFCTWQGEDGRSVSVNAHVLDALGAYVRARPAAREAYGPVMERVAGWLAAGQGPDGSWSDRWHASPYYATLSCALALGEFGGPGYAPAVLAAREWVLTTQRDDGSWGRWTGMPEETAYAVQTLLLGGPTPDNRHKEAALRGAAFLRQVDDFSDYPPLWHDKDLYSPTAIVRAAVLAALYVTETRI